MKTLLVKYLNGRNARYRYEKRSLEERNQRLVLVLRQPTGIENVFPVEELSAWTDLNA